jgi:hypothetical protein
MTFNEKTNTRIGRIRQPTRMERADQDTLLRPDAILVVLDHEIELSPLERHIASLIDGYRPVARVKQKSGLTSADVLQALRGLRKKKVLKLEGVVEEAVGDVLDSRHDNDLDDPTMPHGSGEAIPTHIMREIELMVAEVEENRGEIARDTHRSIPVIDDDESP